MISLTLNNASFNLPTQHHELGKKHFLRLIKHLVFNQNSTTAQMQFITSQIPLKKRKKFTEKAKWLQSQGLTDYQWQGILDECSALFGPIKALPFKKLRHRFQSYTFIDQFLEHLTFGRWCILNECLNQPQPLNTKESIEEAMKKFEVVGEIVLDKKCPNTDWFVALVVRYAQGCILNVIEMQAYAPFFKGPKGNSDAPAFGWYSLANGLAKEGVFGPLEKLKATPLHEVLMHLTEQAIEHRKKSISNQ